MPDFGASIENLHPPESEVQGHEFRPSFAQMFQAEHNDELAQMFQTEHNDDSQLT
jgi:hypothetical protein